MHHFVLEVVRKIVHLAQDEKVDSLASIVT